MAETTTAPTATEPKESSTSVAPALNQQQSSEIQQSNKSDTRNNTGDREGPVALSFDQVNNNVDELVELRGGGRYFGVIDPESGETVNQKQSMGPLCANCHRRGHIRAKCKTVICHKCGVVGDHYETQCPTTMICAKCGGKGHKAIDCTNKVKKKQYCKTCDLFNHNDDNCPNIWRSYLLINHSKDSKEHVAQELPIIYCYNCGDEGHYGDDCKEPRTSRIPNIAGSAFSGNNLPSSLRKIYYRRIQDNALPRKPEVQSYRMNKFNGSNNNGFRKDQPSRSGYIKPTSSGGYRANYNNNNYNNNYNNNNYNNGNYNNYHNNNYSGNYNNNNYNNSNNSNNYDDNRGSRKKRKQAPTRSGFLDNRKKSNFKNLY